MGIPSKKSYRSSGVLLAYFLLLSAPVSSSEKELVEINRVVAKINDRVITWGEIERDMDGLNFSEVDKIKRASEFVDGKIERILSINAFEENGMMIPDSYIEQEYNKRLLEDFNGDRRLFREVLQGNGQSQLEYREKIKENIMHMHMLAKRKRAREEISPARVEEYYDSHLQQFQTEREIRIGEIVLSQTESHESVDAIEANALALRNEIIKSDDFEHFAANNGDSAFREKSGDWAVMVKKSEIRNDQIREKAFGLKRGEVSSPFQVDLLERKPDGSIGPSGKVAFYILKILDEKPAGTLPLSEVREDIERTLASRIESEEQRKWLSRRKRDTYVDIDLPR